MAIGAVRTMSPDYALTEFEEEKRGRTYRFSLCMSCIIKIENFIKGKDFKDPEQKVLF